MKSYTDEDKAKAYDKFVKELKSKFKDFQTIIYDKNDLEKFFPELTESEDERIRKTLYGWVSIEPEDTFKEGFTKEQILAWIEKQGEKKPNYCHHEVDLSNCSEEYRKAYYDGWNNCNMQHSQCKSELNDVIKCLINGMKFYYEDNKEAAWGTEKWSMPVKHIIEVLEKQGEQKSVDKIESKFNVRDWIVRGNTIAQILDIQEQYYIGLDVNGKDFTSSRFLNDDKIHLWSIQDAKDGDVLVASDGSIFLFKCTIDRACKHYVALTTDGVVKFNEGLEHFWETSTSVHPATKEQRDLLFQKIKESGYEWDAESKELKKIEQETAWSEDDGNRINRLIAYFEDKESFTAEDDIVYANWLKSLKDRVQPQPKQEWSEEDRDYYDAIITKLEVTQDDALLTDNQMEFLKSLKERYTWKPSDEQIKALNDALSLAKSCGEEFL